VVAADDDSEQPQAIKKTRWVLLKGWARLDAEERARLHEVQRSNRPRYRGYLLKETLADALDYCQPGRAEKALEIVDRMGLSVAASALCARGPDPPC
jgi:hypothetical protein